MARRIEIQPADELVSKVEQAALQRGLSEQLLRKSAAEKMQRDTECEAAVGQLLG